ncbi:unnamed protein product [Effrenium voratum]|uniref:Uncharacterized protein n=1 Tax=Effrenium voratum TaxID=2562239 RepID=A0AA36NAT1_9DINO|nr:unnamed protein product [Effrenium voratum]CAJ1395543.1 unnamed protein product [Effrenium voratum]CAJ1462403.1 unnamed protein product [Effrenium voratum]
MTGASELSFSFSGGETESLEHRAPPDRCVGLGQGTGGNLARSCLGLVGAQTIKDIRAGLQAQATKEVEEIGNQDAPCPVSPRSTTGAMLSYSEPKGMWFSLLVNDMGPVPKEDLDKVTSHRWTFQGALELAAQGKSICYFILCLLEIQRNIQVDQEEEVLHPSLLEACKTFVRCQCREGKTGEMYQVLTHFISNSLVFFEWERFLNEIFQDSRAHQERFLVTHLEQVWSRYKRLKLFLETIFDYLDDTFTWRHRLPKVGELVRDHMKRRCFSSPRVMRNELFSSQGGRDETLKQVKFTMGFVL